MKTGKRILEVKIKHMVDESPDTSWLGEYSDTPETDFAIDRATDMFFGDIDSDENEQGFHPRQYRYFNPGSVEKFDPSATWIPASETDKKAYWNKAMRSNAQQDYNRMEAYGRGEFGFLGIMATADIAVPTAPGNATVQHITSGGLWGVESDSGDTYLTEIEQEQVSELKEQLTALGFSKRAIATAFKNVKRSD